MKLKALTLENFKGISDPVRIEFSPITLLFGPNNAGKSTVLHALIYAREIFERENLDPRQTILGGEAVDLGGFDNLVFGHDRSRQIRMLFEFEVSSAELYRSIGQPLELVGQKDWTSNSAFEFLERNGRPFFSEVLPTLRPEWIEVRVGCTKKYGLPIIQRCAIGMAENGTPAYAEEYSEETDEVKLVALDFGLIPFGRIHTDESKRLRHEMYQRYGEQPVWYDDDTSDADVWSWQTKEYQDKIKAAGRDFCIDTKDLLRSLLKRDVLCDDDSLRSLAFEGKKSALPKGISLREHVSRRRSTRYGLDRNGKIKVTGIRAADGNQIWDDPNGVVDWFLDPLLNTFSLGVITCFKQFFQESLYLSSVRVHPPRNLLPVRPLDQRRWPNGLAAWDLLLDKEDELVGPVNRWLNDDATKFSSGFRVEVQQIKNVDVRQAPISELLKGAENVTLDQVRAHLARLPEEHQLRVRNMATGVEGHPRDFGYGLSQLLPVIVAALDTKAGVVAIEEPESNIHPAFQVVLADLFITQAKANPDVLFLIETHSEHLLLRCLRRIRECGEDAFDSDTLGVMPDDIAVNFIEPSDKGPLIHRIRIDEDGEFMDPWPRGFFPERMKEVYGDDL